MALGSVVHRENDEMLDPLIDLVFYDAAEQNVLPEPPEELQGMELGVEYVSILVQAMKMVGVAGVDRGVGFITALAAAGKADALDMIKTYETVSNYWDSVGAPVNDLVDRKLFDAIQEKKVTDAKNAQAGALIPAGADVAKTLSEIPMDQDTALTRMADNMGMAQ